MLQGVYHSTIFRSEEWEKPMCSAKEKMFK